MCDDWGPNVAGGRKPCRCLRACDQKIPETLPGLRRRHQGRRLDTVLQLQAAPYFFAARFALSSLLASSTGLLVDKFYLSQDGVEINRVAASASTAHLSSMT